MRARIPAVLFACAACVETGALDLPEARDARSAVILAVAGGKVIGGGAVDLGRGGFVAAVARDQDLYALLYAQPLDELFLEHGALTLIDTFPARSLPDAGSVFVAAAGERRWQLAADTRALESAKLPVVPASACAAPKFFAFPEDRCAVGGQLSEERVCVAAPAVEVDAPAESFRPEPPAIAPCPAGWSERASEGVTTCEPSPRTTCAEDEMQALGEPRCRALGDPCPSDPWAEPPADAAAVVYVSAGAGAGDGTRDAPFASIADALAIAPDGAAIMLARGEYVEDVVVDRAVALIGACVAQTKLQGATLATINITGGDVELGGLTLSGARSAVLIEHADPRSSTAISGVRVAATQRYGVIVRRGSLIARDVRFDAIPTIAVSADAPVELTRVAFLGSGGHAIWARQATATVTLADVQIIDSGGGGAAIDLRSGARLVARELLIAGSASRAIIAEDASIRLDHAIVRDSATTGLFASRSDVELHKTRFERSKQAILTDASSVTIGDLLIDRTRGGEALAVQKGRLHAERIALRDTVGESLHLGEVATATLSDVFVVRTSSGSGCTFHCMPNGIHAYLSPMLMRDVLVEDVDASAVVLDADDLPEPFTRIEQLVTRRSKGAGFDVDSGSVAVDRARIEDAAGQGVYIRDHANASIADVFVRSTHASQVDLTSYFAGHGIAVGRAILHLSRFHSEANTAYGLFVRCEQDDCPSAERGGFSASSGLIFENGVGAIDLFQVARKNIAAKMCDVYFRGVVAGGD